MATGTKNKRKKAGKTTRGQKRGALSSGLRAARDLLGGVIAIGIGLTPKKKSVGGDPTKTTRTKATAKTTRTKATKKTATKKKAMKKTAMKKKARRMGGAKKKA